MPRLSWNRTGAVSPPTRRVHFGLRCSSASRPPAGAASQMDTQHGGAGGGRSLSQVYCGASLLVARLATSPFHRRERLGDGRHCPAGRSNAKDQRLEQRCVSATATCGHAATILGPSSSFPVQQESAPRRPLVVASRTAGQHPNQLGLPIPLSEVKLVQPVSACPPGLSMAPPCSRGSTPRRRAAPLREEAREDQNCAHELMLLSRCC